MEGLTRSIAAAMMLAGTCAACSSPVPSPPASTPPTISAALDTCALLLTTELEQATGESPWQGFRSPPAGATATDPTVQGFAGTTCYFQSSTNPSHLVVLATKLGDGCAGFRGGANVLPVSAIGDQAWIASSNQDAHICALKGNMSLMLAYLIASPNPRDQAILLASEAASRL